MKSANIRREFLKYFERNSHKIVSSSSLVPANDPTLFFTNAGMVQFKEVFLGNEKRDFSRATSSQKCMRVSGKHNDLENVGRTARHHTFFEMLGNFSFGDYFKEEAISFAWNFLTKKLHLSKDRIYITIYKDDDEAEKLWQRHVDKSRIFRLGEKDNFWVMADVGPCGPCSEIIYDRDPSQGEVRAEELDNERYLEIWNLVFMQFRRGEDGKLTKLKKPSIDTGMGLERLTSILEDTTGNYETDLFLPLINELEKITGKKYQADYSEKASDDFSMRVIADHIRSISFLIADGVQPSNEGRGYVLRRITRRAARHAKLLKINEPIFVRLANILIDMMGSSYPELIQHKSFIEKVILNEEEKFNETLDKGLGILKEEFEKLKKSDEEILPGEVVFRLYDTYGFPKDLTEDIAMDEGFDIDESGFENCMNQQREKARGAWKGSGEESVDKIYKEFRKEGVFSEFVGYKELSQESKIKRIIKDGGRVKKAESGDEVLFVTEKTPFYGESGGQIGDSGVAVSEDAEIEIRNTLKPLPDLIAHKGIVKKGKISEGDILTLAVDAEKRGDISRNHTATHILHKALREVLGEHVKQSGSLVNDTKLRFDFSHFSSPSEKELEEVERNANQIVRRDLAVAVKEQAYDEAISNGALAFFGDKYGEMVRTIGISDYSLELCGGAHVGRTGEIGIIKIISENSVASGVRRIEAVTGREAEKYISNLKKKIDDIASLLKASGEEVDIKVKKLIKRNREMDKEILRLKSKMISGGGGDLSPDIEKVGKINVIAKYVEGVKAKELRTTADNLKTKIGSGIIMLVAEDEDKTTILIGITEDLIRSYKAGDLVKEVVSVVGGTGGGRPDLAQGGAPVTGKFQELKERLFELVK